MRDLANEQKITEFMLAFGQAARSNVRVIFTGGSTAVLHGWRNSTVTVDLCFDPESAELFRAIPKIKEGLRINVELAAPSDFKPQLPGWENRSIYIDTIGKASFLSQRSIQPGSCEDRARS